VEEMSFFPRSILLATDGSEEARLATQAAIELSKATGSEVHVLYVQPSAGELIGPHTYPADRRESLLEQAERDARKFLDEQAERIGSEGASVAETHLRTGRADKEVVRISEELGVGMIVLGSRGLGAVSRALMGSVSDSVVRHAHCPVFVVRADEARL
jgi:nucleotide-binding universal stress UspA family protein